MHRAGFNLLQLVCCQLLEKRICLAVWVQQGPDVELWGQKKEAGGSVSLQRVKDQQDVDKLTNQETSTPSSNFSHLFVVSFYSPSTC